MSFTYRGLQGRLEKHTVTEEEVNHQLHRLQQQTPRITAVKDRAAQLGDEVVLDYAGFCNGEQFAGGTAQNQTLVLGSGMFIPGFEEQLVDKVPEEKVVVKVTFPTEYHAPELAGKEAEFHCTIHEIRLKGAYELDDVFAKEVGQCDTLDEMRTKLQESMQSYADDRAEMELQFQLLCQAAETLEITISDEELEAGIDQQLNTLRAQLAQQRLTLEMYCQFMNTDEAKLREDARPAAITAIRNQAAVDTIVQLENLTAEQEDISQALALVCRQNGLTMDQLRDMYDAEMEKAVTNSVLTSKAVRLIRDAADVAEI